MFARNGLGIVTLVSTLTKSLGPLVVWTLFVWVSRLRNIWGNDDLTTNGQLLRTLFAGIFVLFGVAAARVLWVRGRRGSDLTSSDQRMLWVFVVWTIGFWLVRGIGIIVDDHTASFTAVHTVLMVVSIAIALLATRVLARPSISSSRLAAR